MKKILFGLVILIVLAIGGVLIGPSFIDWNEYKADIAGLVKDATGRDLTIDGNISIAVLPAPALVAENVRLANVEGAMSPDMARLRSVEVRIRLAPLLNGNVVVETVRLIEPVIEMEVLADGSSSLSFASGDDPSTDAAATAEGQAVDSLAVSLENFVIQDGTLIYRDHAENRVERIDSINASIAAASLRGPFESTGRMVLRGVPLNFDVTIGEIVNDRTVPLTGTLESQVARAHATVNGALTGLSANPTLKGRITGSGESLAAAMYAITGNEDLPGSLAQDFSIDGEITASGERAEINDLSFQLGTMQGTAVGSVRPGETLAVSAAISVTRLDLDSWMALPPFEPTSVGDAALPDTDSGSGEGGSATARIDPPAAETPAPEPQEDAPFAIPTDVVGVLDVNIGTVSIFDGLIRQVRASAELSNGEITVSQLAAQLPGSSDAAIFGFVAAENGVPRFEGELDATVNDLRRIMEWLDVEAPSVPSDRLRSLTLKSNLVATPEQIEVTGLNMQLDSSTVTGGVTVALRQRPAFGANLALDRVNLDAYLPTQAASGPEDGGAAPDLGALNALTGFDANLKAQIGELTYRRTPINDITLDATIFNGDLQIREARIGDAAGSSLRLAGGVGPMSGLPALRDVSVSFRAEDTGRLFRLLEMAPPIPPEQLGAVSFDGRVDGQLLAPTVNATLGAAGAEATIAGSTSFLTPDSLIDADISFRHGDLPRLLRAIGVDYRPAGPVGAIDLTGHVAGGAGAVDVTGLQAQVGDLTVGGDVAVNLAGERPRIEAQLNAGNIVVDRFLPAAQAARIQVPAGPHYGPGIVPAAWPAPPPADLASPRVDVATDPAERWSREPLDLSALGLLDGTLTLQAESIAYQRYRLQSADIAASLSGGILRAERIAGGLFGGALQGGLEVNTNEVPRVSSSMTLERGSIDALMTVLESGARPGGSLNANLQTTASGASVAGIVSSLGGNGAFSLAGMDVQSQAQGTPLSGLMQLFGGLSQLGGALTGGRSDSRADVDGSFVIDRGIARSEDIRLASALGNGSAAGTVDLPAWLIDMAGEINLQQNLAASLLAQQTGGQVPSTLPFRVQGPLDAPNVKLETAGLQGGGIRLPGKAQEFLDQDPAGQLLRQIVPGLGSAPAPAQPQQQPRPQQQPQQQQQQQQRPEEQLLRGILEGLGR